LIFVQVPDQNTSSEKKNIQDFSPLDRYIKNTRIVRFSPGSRNAVNLSEEFYAAADPDISFDGRHIIFAGKKEAEDHWQIWQMKIDGSDKKQITKSDGDCYMPVHVGTRFYLNDPEPTPQIIYVGTEHKWQNYAENSPILSLYGTDLQGEITHRLSFNLNNDFSPDVLPDGRIIFSSWQHSGGDSGIIGRYAFMGINNDGTDIMTYYGNLLAPDYKDMIAISDTDHRVYFIESNQLYWLGGGDIGQLSQKRPLNTYRRLAKEDNGIFHSPCPTPDGGLLASYRMLSAEDVFSIYRVNPTSGKRGEKIFKQSEWHSIDTQILMQHPQVKGRSNWLIPGSETGVFYCLDSYRTNLPEFGSIEPGSVKNVRVIEGIPKNKNSNKPDSLLNLKRLSDSDKNFSSIYGSSRILGVAPVQDDGSFQIRVPAEIPLKFQLLDENYLAVRSQEAWTWVMGNENRGCIGCHENPELSPNNILVDAVIKPPTDLTIPPEQRRKIDFRHQIGAIIKGKCATTQCHGSEKIKPDFNFVENRANDEDLYNIYRTLLASSQDRDFEKYVVPGRAIDSPLIWHIFGEQMNKIKTKAISQMKIPPKISSLDLDEKMLIIEWIDLGAAWDYSEQSD
jgi:hypothetical protein